MLLLGFVPAWGAGVAAYLACVVSLARGGASAAPWLAASLLFAVGAWPLMLSGIGVLAFVGALALAVGARTRPRFRDARPLALGLAALTLPALVLLLSFAAGRPSPADVLVLGALGGVALAAGWPAGRAPSPERAA